MLSIEKAEKKELLRLPDEQTVLKRRQRKDKANLVKMSSSITEQLLSISRQLADTTQRSADTLNTLAISSKNVQDTQHELQNTNSTISQSGKLLDKYARRQFTDKLIIPFGFIFFLACVIYIIMNRLF
ncbi:hypothetical protein AAG570_010151 [Ranatra chinensis]|uniref:Sec20 C-terminal domain-containing protein n=1 Tax=Ranatra chinensis TaxID=642074 RepID=A0ABD0ZA22_9HEMI